MDTFDRRSNFALRKVALNIESVFDFIKFLKNLGQSGQPDRRFEVSVGGLYLRLHVLLY